MSSNKKIISNYDIITGLFFLVFCAFFYFRSSNLSASAKLFPMIILSCLTICSVSLIGLNILQRNKLNLTRKKDNKTDSIKLEKIKITKKQFYSEIYTLIFFLLVVAYIILLPLIGFEYSSIIFIVFGIWLINKKQLKKNFYIAILIPIIFTILFRIILNVSLPASKIPFVSF